MNFTNWLYINVKMMLIRFTFCSHMKVKIGGIYGSFNV